MLFLCVGCDQGEGQEKETLNKNNKQLEPDHIDYYTAMHSSKSSFDTLLSYVTDIVKVKYKETQNLYWKSGASYSVTYAHKFETVDSLRENPNTPNIIVATSVPMFYSCGYSTVDIPYEKNKCYLLLLKNSIDVYGKRTNFIEDSLVIPLDENQNPDIEQSHIYSEKLTLHIENEQLKSADNENFLRILLEKVKNNSHITKIGEFCEETDINAIISQTPYIALVQIKEKTAPNETFNLVTCKCEVLTVWKGDLNVDEFEIVLPSDMVKEGYAYNLAIKSSNNSQKPYELFGYRSVYPVE